MTIENPNKSFTIAITNVKEREGTVYYGTCDFCSYEMNRKWDEVEVVIDGERKITFETIDPSGLGLQEILMPSPVQLNAFLLKRKFILDGGYEQLENEYDLMQFFTTLFEKYTEFDTILHGHTTEKNPDVETAWANLEKSAGKVVELQLW